MRLFFSSLALASALALTGIASAQTSPTPVPLPKKPDFAPLNFTVGTWSCSNKSSRRPQAITWKQTNVLSPDGYWLVNTSDSVAVPWYPHATHSVDRITYDPDTGKWVDVEYDDNGGYDVSTSAGPNAATWTWHDANLSLGKDVASVTDTVWVKESDTKISFHNTLTTKAGQVVTVTGSCSKGT